MWRGPLEYATYEFVSTSPVVSRMPGSSNLDSFLMGGKWLYSCCFVECCLQDLFNIGRSNTWLEKAWTAIDRLSVTWKSDLTDKRKRSFFQAVVVSILVYGGSSWTLSKRRETKLCAKIDILVFYHYHHVHHPQSVPIHLRFFYHPTFSAIIFDKSSWWLLVSAQGCKFLPVG